VLDTRKIIRISLKESTSPLTDIFSTFDKRIGFKNGQSPVIPTYYYRYIGTKENESTYYNELKELDKKLIDLKNLYLKFLNNIPLPNSNEFALKTEAIWKKYNPISPSNKNDLFNELKHIDVYPKLNNTLYKTSMIESFIDLMELYFTNESSINISKKFSNKK